MVITMEGEESLRNRITSGFKGGDFFKFPPRTPKRPFVKPNNMAAEKAHAKPAMRYPTKK
jgi:hypothetical protein